MRKPGETDLEQRVTTIDQKPRDHEDYSEDYVHGRVVDRLVLLVDRRPAQPSAAPAEDHGEKAGAARVLFGANPGGAAVAEEEAREQKQAADQVEAERDRAAGRRAGEEADQEGGPRGDAERPEDDQRETADRRAVHGDELGRQPLAGL